MWKSAFHPLVELPYIMGLVRQALEKQMGNNDEVEAKSASDENTANHIDAESVQIELAANAGLS